MSADTFAPRPRTTFSPPAIPRPCVLVVDDEPAIRMIARFILEHAGYAVTDAGTAAEGLAIARGAARSFAIVLLDLTLPDRNGTDLLPELRAAAPAAQVILTSGRAEEDVPDHGADAYLPKPFTREQLLTAIRGGGAIASR